MTLQANGASRWTAELVELVANDGRCLEGFLHETSGPAKASILLLHGKGANCYSGVCRFLPPALTRAGFRVLALNMRSHDLGYTRLDVPFVDLEDGRAAVDGGMWEDLDVGDLDVDAGIAFLNGFGGSEVIVCGHSSGGFYAALHDRLDSRVTARILLSPLVSNRRPLPSWFGGSHGLEQALARAQALVERGDGEQLIPTQLWYYAISARALLQRAAESPDIFATALAALSSPALLAWGSREGRAAQWSQLASGLPHVTSTVFDGAEHNYIQHQDTVNAGILQYLKTLT